jgi:CPA1 family monovalent cation:H+ antiporter/cell volume regulation protein A
MQVVRFLMVHALLWHTPFTRHERIFVSCAGLRGAVPIAMAIDAWSSGISWGASMPPLALAVVLYGLCIQGFALVPLAERMNLILPSPQHDPDAAA